MNPVVQITQCIDGLDNEKLSKTIIKAMAIALLLEAYDDWLFLKMQTINHDQLKSSHVMDEYGAMQSKKGLSTEEIACKEELVLSKYMNCRITGIDGQIQASSIIGIESSLETLEKESAIFEMPEGMASVDIYFKDQSYKKTKLKILEDETSLKKIYGQIKASIGDVLTNMAVLANSKEQSYILGDDDVKCQNVFIIHGHNEAKWRELCSILKDDFGLNPIVLMEQPGQGRTIIEKFENFAKTSAYAFAIFTHDDIVVNGGKEYLQVRPNVIFELGWFYARLGRKRVCILDQSKEGSEIFSDLQGIERYTFDKDVKEVYKEIALELKESGLV
ncbi:nucleotide-binding protein [Christensenellaceae bacterium OttesenSCG-928-K19]|nr:nucleotide-binding protein [Christensenellaceae bacterium OttesenSCG-928-K19]